MTVMSLLKKADGNLVTEERGNISLRATSALDVKIDKHISYINFRNMRERR